jgi:hypothetical protein
VILFRSHEFAEENNLHDFISEHLQLWGFAIGVLFLLFEAITEKTKSREPSLNDHRHPPAAHRALWLQATSHVGIHADHYDSQQIFSYLSKGFQEARAAWIAIGCPASRDVPKDINAFLANIRSAYERVPRPKDALFDDEAPI